MAHKDKVDDVSLFPEVPLRPWAKTAGDLLHDVLKETASEPPPLHPPKATPLPITERLRRLQNLFDEGLITSEEYQAKRREILNRL